MDAVAITTADATTAVVIGALEASAETTPAAALSGSLSCCLSAAIMAADAATMASETVTAAGLSSSFCCFAADAAMAADANLTNKIRAEVNSSARFFLYYGTLPDSLSFARIFRVSVRCFPVLPFSSGIPDPAHISYCHL